jgi:DNA mismatch repair ATPase MutS
MPSLAFVKRYGFQSRQQSVPDTFVQVVASLLPIRRNSHILDEIDVLAGFARLATEMKYSRPKLVAEFVTT